jgi:hypothetical protein
MKQRFFTLAAILFLALSLNSAQAQYFCFFVDNQSNQTFNELRIRATAKGGGFSADLLPSNMIETGKHFWVRTGDDKYDTYDVQITKMDGSYLLFSWEDVSGKFHDSKPFITVNVKDLHTLVIGVDDEGNLTFGVYNEDEFGYGHPCD